MVNQNLSNNLPNNTPTPPDGNFDIWLILLMIGTILLYGFKHFDDEEIDKLSKGAKFRKVITGGVGSSIVVFLVYEVLTTYFPVHPRLALGAAGLFGYIGAEVTIRFLEEIGTEWIKKKLGLKPSRNDDEGREF